MESLIDSRTKAILINNPSNPCGSNYSLDHLAQVVAVAQKHGLPIIADEIYGGVVFNGKFNPIQLIRGDVPVLSLGGELFFYSCVNCGVLHSSKWTAIRGFIITLLVVF